MTPTTLDSNTSDTKNNIRSVGILGDSLIKHVNGWKISKKLPSNTEVCKRTFQVLKLDAWKINLNLVCVIPLTILSCVKGKMNCKHRNDLKQLLRLLLILHIQSKKKTKT